MSNRFESVFDPPTPEDDAARAVSAVQTSLFSRLRHRIGPKAGVLAWAIVRLAQPRHRDHRAAAETIIRYHANRPADFAVVVSAVRGCGRALAARPACVALYERVAAALRAIADDGVPDPLESHERAEFDALTADGGELSPRARELLALIGPDGFRVGS